MKVDAVKAKTKNLRSGVYELKPLYVPPTTAPSGNGSTMGESLKKRRAIRHICSAESPDETALERIEELLFTDEEFCSRVALAEDDLIQRLCSGPSQ